MNNSTLTIKQIRQLTGLSQADFAKKYNIPVTTIKKWEAPPGSINHREPPEYLKKLLEKVVRYEL